MAKIHPWNERLWRRIVSGRERLPHGILFSGPAGVGKTALGLELARTLACAAPAGEGACGTCHACRMFSAGSLPDFHLLTTELAREEAGRETPFALYGGRYLEGEAERRKRTRPRSVLSVGQVRALIDGFSTRAHTASHKVAMIAPAEAMNPNAANALLKLLEEPPDDSTLVLVSSEPARLPATIRSRCMTLQVGLPAAVEARAWLQSRGLEGEAVELALRIAGGAPLAALALARSELPARHPELAREFELVLSGGGDPVAVAERWQSEDFGLLLLWLQRMVADLVRSRSGLPPLLRERGAPDEPALERLFDSYDTISRLRRLAGDQINPQLALEEVLLSLYP